MAARSITGAGFVGALLGAVLQIWVWKTRIR